jgi:hypothetical protein
MMCTNSLEESSSPAVDPHAEVEKMYIAEYLKGKGYSVEGLAELPKEVAKRLLEAASLYASLRLAELETGAALVGTLHLDDSLTTAPRVEQTSTSNR